MRARDIMDWMNHRHLIWVVSTLLWAVGACESGQAEPTAAIEQAPANELAAAAEGPAGPPSPTGDTQASPSASSNPDSETSQGGLSYRLETELSVALAELAQQRVWAREIGDRVAENAPMSYMGPSRRSLLRSVYEEFEGHPLFVRLDGTEHGRAGYLLVELNAAYQHAIDPSPYRIEETERLLTFVGEPLPVAPQWEIDETAIALLLPRAEALESANSEDVMGSLARALAGIDGEAPIPGVEAQFNQYIRTLRDSASTYVELELALANAFMSYVYDMHHFNVNMLSDEEVIAAGGARRIQRERMRQSFRDAMAVSPEGFGDQLEDLLPNHPQYPRLMQAMARYRNILADGGWVRVAPRSMHVGSQSSRVTELKTRLAIEGYYTGEIDDLYDEELAAAVSHYQTTHQMDITGEPHNNFWSSLNIPTERRLAQIVVSLQRWRETRLQDEEYYVFVNIPAFTAQVWDHGQIVYETKVVTGNNQRECDPRTNTLRYVNATPLLRAEMEYLVFNPYWNVPNRIWREELDPEIAENPEWLQRNNYEVIVTEFGPRLRQTPGDHNALGRVKFIFPNIHSIYLHDTPAQRYFGFNIRAFSHGCVRVFEPLQLAEFLLTRDGTQDAASRIQELLDSARQRTVQLDSHIPIFVEYYVTTIDDDGFANFLADVYRYDRERMGDYEPPSCEPEPEQEQLVVWAEDGTAQIPDGRRLMVDGTVVAPDPLAFDPQAANPGDETQRTVRRVQVVDNEGQTIDPNPAP